jgi:MFS family permease
VLFEVLVPSTVTLYAAAVMIGVGVGIVTPLGFAVLAAVTPADRMGRTMGSAELGREVGDAGGPILVGVIAGTASLSIALGGMAVIIAAAGAFGGALLRARKE